MSENKILSCGHEVASLDQVHYCTYIGLERLEELAVPHDPAGNSRRVKHHDEIQFVVVHQSCELAFRLMLAELNYAISLIGHSHYDEATRTVGRVSAWIKHVIGLHKLLFNMRPEDFGAFREHLRPASGAESPNFRRVEILSGLRSDSPYCQIGEKTFTFKETLCHQASVQGPFYTNWWLTEFDQLTCQNSLWLAFQVALGEDAVSDVLPYVEHPLNTLAGALSEYEFSFLNLRKVHCDLAEHQIGQKSGLAVDHMSGGTYLRGVLEKARFFPGLTS